MSGWVKVGLWLTGVIAVAALCLYVFARWYFGVLFPTMDYQPPQLPSDMSRPAILVFNKANGFVHIDAIPAGNSMLTDIAARNGWSIYLTDKGAVMNAEQLAQFDVVVWNNTSGTTLTGDQQEAFRQWLENGGGFVGIHAAGGDLWYTWDWYVDDLLGAQFTGHTMSPQFQDAQLIKPVQNPITGHLPERWGIPQEEWYAFDRNPGATGSTVLLALDESSYLPGNSAMQGEHPSTWQHDIKGGRVFYTAIGHHGKTYSIPEYRQLIEQGIRWSGRF